MSKRTGLRTTVPAALQVGIAAKEAAIGQSAPERVDELYAGSAVNLRRTDWKLLRKVAEARSEIRGGRPSVSKVLESLIDANRKALESEID